MMAKQSSSAKRRLKAPNTRSADRKLQAEAVEAILRMLRSGPEGVRKFVRTGFPDWLDRDVINMGRMHWLPQWIPLDLSGMTLVNLNMSRVHSSRANFAGADLSNSDLSLSSFAKGNFRGAILRGAELRELKLQGANMQGADCSGARMRHVSLRAAQCRNASFVNADMTHVNLCCADLTGAKLRGANLQEARYDQNTRWPRGFWPTAQMRWVGFGMSPVAAKKEVIATDIHGLLARLHKIIDPARMRRVLDMLQKERHHLFCEVDPAMIGGVVRSHKKEGLFYSCLLTEDGVYSCATPDLDRCMGLSDEPCKHILVLVIGLARTGLLDPATADRWMLAAKTKGPRWNKTLKNRIGDLLLKYKGAEAGEVDWRPTETIPEDYYAM